MENTQLNHGRAVCVEKCYVVISAVSTINLFTMYSVVVSDLELLSMFRLPKFVLS